MVQKVITLCSKRQRCYFQSHPLILFGWLGKASAKRVPLLFEAAATDYKTMKYGDRFISLSIRHLLDMRAVFDADDSYSLGLKGFKQMKMMSDMEYSHDLSGVVKHLKFRYVPGEVHEYNSFTTAVLGLVLERGIGKAYSDYLSGKVWWQLGMDRDAMVMIDSPKHRHGYSFGGIVTNMLDLAKIGRLYLNGGVWEGRRIVSEDWIRQSTEYSSENEGYSLCWYNLSSVGPEEWKHPGFYATASAARSST